MHLADGWLTAIGAAKSSTSSGPSVWDIVSTVLGAGAFLTFLSWIVDRIRTRSRFGATALIDDDGTVRASLVKKGKRKGYVQAIKVVVVKPRLYKWASKIVRTDEVSKIEVMVFTDPEKPLERDEPFDAHGTLPEKYLLPSLLNPFGRFKEREWKRCELRVELTISTSKRSRYIRCKHKGGRFSFGAPTPDERVPSPG